MPSLFIGHGSPMNAVAEADFMPDWARRDARVGESAQVAVATREHHPPLLYIAGLRFADESPALSADEFDRGSIGVRRVSYGLTVSLQRTLPSHLFFQPTLNHA